MIFLVIIYYLLVCYISETAKKWEIKEFLFILKVLNRNSSVVNIANLYYLLLS